MTFGPAKRYPSGPITPHGAYYTLNDRKPLMALRAYDDSIVFNLMGGLAIHDPTAPERVELKGLKGLISPWTVIDQKGASQDGVSFVDALYDPIEIEATVRAVGRDPAHCRQVVRDLVGSIDTKEESELSFFTHYLGRWWAPVRWFKAPDDPLESFAGRSQELRLVLRADSGFWQSYPHVSQFRFDYEDLNEPFDFFTAQGDPITGWTLAYSGAGSGSLYTDGAQAVSSFSGARTVVARNTGYTAGTDSVVIQIEFGSNSQPSWPDNTFIDVWGRMNNTGTAGTDGVRFRVGRNIVRLSSFDAGVETLIRQQAYVFPLRPTERLTCMFGMEGQPRTFKLLRNNATWFTAKELGAFSLINSAHRKAGFGMSTTSGVVRPIAIRNWKVGVDNKITQEGFVERINVGDQPMWDRYTCFGPGIFYFANGPSSSEFVKFGPLLPNQIMQIRTDPRERGVVDMTSIQPTAQQRALAVRSIQDYLSFIFQGRVPTSPQAISSIFGVFPPQGNPYSILDGRFSEPIPPRSPGQPVTPYHVKVKIDNGNSDSQIIIAGTPLRRLPY